MERTASEAQAGNRMVPTEEQEQRLLCEWAAFQGGRFPELKLLVHIPNEGKRSFQQGQRLKAIGLRRGFPDLFLPVACGGYHGLMIELKRRSGGRVSPEQREWLSELTAQGYRAALCCGADEAIEEIKKYLGGKQDGIR